MTAAMPVIGMLLFTVYLFNLTGVWFAWARSHEAWGRTYQGFGPFVTAFGWLRDEPFLQVVGNIPFNVLNALGVLFAVALAYPVFRRLGLAWGVFVLVNVIPPLFAWFVCMTAVTVGRYLLYKAFIQLNPPAADNEKWAVGGIPWDNRQAGENSFDGGKLVDPTDPQIGIAG